MPDLFIGITSWHDAPFIQRAITALRQTLAGVDVRIVAWDNKSNDDTCATLHRLQVPYISQQYPQGDALNALLAMSDAPYTLLMHSDTILLHDEWFTMLRSHMQETGVALISPEDIGLGNMTRRSIGTGMPESSFLFFDTAKIMACRRPRWGRFLEYSFRGKKGNPFLRLDLYGDHVTHRLPLILQQHGFTWSMMKPLTSPRYEEPWFTSPFTDKPEWAAEYIYYRYGFGNFYAFDGVITHYHNWYARFIGGAQWDKAAPNDIRVVYQQYCNETTRQFFADYDTGQLVLPAVN